MDALGGRVVEADVGGGPARNQRGAAIGLGQADGDLDALHADPVEGADQGAGMVMSHIRQDRQRFERRRHGAVILVHSAALATQAHCQDAAYYAAS